MSRVTAAVDPQTCTNPLTVRSAKAKSSTHIVRFHPNRTELHDIPASTGKYAQFSVLDINGKFAKIPLLKNKIGPKSPFFVCKTDLWI